MVGVERTMNMKLRCRFWAICTVTIMLAGCGLSNTQSVRKDADAHDEIISTEILDRESSRVDLSGNSENNSVDGDASLEAGDAAPATDVPSVSAGSATQSAEQKTDSGQSDAAETVSSLESEQALLDTALEFCNASQQYWSEGNLDKAIETLDQAYNYVLRVDTERYPELLQQKEDLRFLISKRVLEIYASRYTAVNGNHNEIPLTMNQHVEREIKLFQGQERQFFLDSYRRAGRYMPDIVNALRKAGLPEELAWLPLIESGFKVNALSRARALGLWQFIPSTGYKYGLKRDTWIDERLDPEKSTMAVISYLKELHQIFGDWTTVLAGYNCGEGAVLRTIRNQSINYLDNFWDLFMQLPQETARYVPKFLATLHILRDPAKYGFSLEEQDQPVPFEEVEIEKAVQLKMIAQELNISIEDLISLNPELRYQATPPSHYSLKVPDRTGEALLARLDNIPSWTPAQTAYIYHRVSAGETLSVIALRYRTTVSRITRVNHIGRNHLIRIGQKLKIPLRGGGSSTLYAYEENLLPGGKYRVSKGDSLWQIARKFNTDTKTLQRINNLKSTMLSVGQVLRVTD